MATFLPNIALHKAKHSPSPSVVPALCLPGRRRRRGELGLSDSFSQSPEKSHLGLS